jgi:hypothetical protein
MEVETPKRAGKKNKNTPLTPLAYLQENAQRGIADAGRRSCNGQPDPLRSLGMRPHFFYVFFFRTLLK